MNPKNSLKTMLTHTEKTPEQELKDLIEESKRVVARMRKTLNVMYVIAGVVFIPFFYSFVDVRVRMSELEKTTMPKEQIYATFPTKSSVVYLQNDIFDMNGIFFQKNEGLTDEKREKEYEKALKQFVGDVSRGSTN